MSDRVTAEWGRTKPWREGADGVWGLAEDQTVQWARQYEADGWSRRKTRTLETYTLGGGEVG